MSDGTFLAYILLLIVSGGLLLALAIGGFGQSTVARVFDALFGVGFLGYAVYLLFFFQGTEVRILFYAFIVPVFAIVQMVKARKAKREEQAAPQGLFPGQPAAFGQPGQPGQVLTGQPVGDPNAQPGAVTPPAPPQH
jgi:hypothetical protein